MTGATCGQIVKGKTCGGTIDPDAGVCETCGRAPDKGALLATVEPAARATPTSSQGMAASGSGRVSRRHGGTTSRRQSHLGGGLVSLPPAPSRDPLTQVMASPEAPPGKRICPSCGARVNRMHGFCPRCSAAYDFRPGLKNGDLVAGKYEIKGPIGLGGMGWIYLAEDTVLKRWVVLKGVLNEKDADAAAAALAERQFLAAVKHPNIVAIYDFVSHGPQGYMVLEYVGGRTLDDIRADRDVVDLLSPEDGKLVRADIRRADIQPDESGLMVQVKRFGVLEPEEALAYIMAICPAFAYLHAAGLTHNDMKPDNVMVEGDTVKVVDLGAMRRIGDPGGLIFGTEGFFAPEAAEDPIPVSDIYSIGRTLAVLLMDFLYKARVDRDQVTQALTTRRLLVTGYKAALPSPDEQPLLKQRDSLYRLLLRATHPDPDERFQSADDLQIQIMGVLREIVAETSGPRPADSPVFFGDGLIDAGDVQGAAAPLPRLAPRLKADPADPAAGRLMSLANIIDPVQRRAELDRIVAAYPQSVEANLKLAEFLGAEGEVSRAASQAERLLATNPFEWRARWSLGLSHLTTATAEAAGTGAAAAARKALEQFDRVYFEMPGELAPRLALGMAYELAGDLASAATYYARVAATDDRFAAAAFGLARCRLRAGDWEGAAAALLAIPGDHAMYPRARLELARLNIEADGAKHPDALAKAAAALETVTLESAEKHDLSGRLLSKAADQGRAGGATERLLGAPMTPTALRLAAASHFLAAGRLAPDAEEKAVWVDRANAARPLTLI